MTVNHLRESGVDDDSGVNLALLTALPAACKILEIGCATGRLGRRYKRTHPTASWIGVDISDTALTVARPHLDGVLQLDLDVDPIARVGTGFDLVVIGDVLEHLRQPEKLLGDLRSICTENCHLVCCIPNMSHISVIERLVRGDIMYDRNGLLDATHLHFLSPRSAFKMFLDAGWLPNAAGGYNGGHRNARFVRAIVEAAQALGIPQKAAELNVNTYQLIVRCLPRTLTPTTSSTRTKVSVIVLADDDGQLDLNVRRSPGLLEIQAEIIVCRNADSAGAGFTAGVTRASGDWFLLCHDDVYFPRGTGFELVDILNRIAPGDTATTLLGFAGLGIDEALQPFQAGLMVEQRTLRDFPSTDRAISIADFAVLLHRNSPLVIDPALGRYLWATDLCLQSIYGPTSRFPQIVRIPLLHNSVDDGSLPEAYATSAKSISSKYPNLPSIATLKMKIGSDGTLSLTALPDRAPLKNFSCSYSRLYASGGFYESSNTARAFVDIGDECRWTANLYAPYSYDRPQPVNVLSRDPALSTSLSNECQELNASYPYGASCDLFKLENGLLFNRCLYKAFGGEIIQMYETNKPPDRPWRTDLDPAWDLQAIEQPRDAAKDFFYLGSIGSENYGHWLIDDLTRARSLLAHFRPDRIPVIVLDAQNPIIDSVREQSLHALTYEIADIEIIFLNYRSAYFFPRLFFVSPSSYHPSLKCPQGVAFLREHFIAQAARMPLTGEKQQLSGAGTHLFVTRRALWRNLINLEPVSEYFRNLSFDIVEIEGMSFIEQVRTFSRAEVVVGVGGAGMTNVVFSPEGATVVHLGPEGWKDLFFWDLAAVKKHRYSLMFGKPLKPEAPAFTPFTIEPSQLDVLKSWL